MIRHSISNIAWNTEHKESVYTFLSNQGFEGVEVALTKFAPWEMLDHDIVEAERALLKSHNLTVSSYQALFFGKTHLQLLGEPASFRELIDHTVKVARIAQQLSGGGVGVFGSPRNRLRGTLSEREAQDIGAERFHHLAEAIAPYNFVLALEPAPTLYGGDFLLDTSACAAMVRQVNHPSLRLHLDTGCVNIAGDDGGTLVTQFGHLIAHVHLSRPQLAPIDSNAVSANQNTFRALLSQGFKGWIAIEMRETKQAFQDITSAVQALQSAL
ncbi:sugar phosphate isomerase/epimerase family protein [Methylobacterium oryzisoli]|uniref:sugar phosphate isomerase/epimerase family protein n=1 Tax=Methylobacterium oryzisoli TaxID=3385502 RepID=UPI0038918ACB